MAGKCVVLISILAFIVQVQGYKLKQALLLSRHSVRTPLEDIDVSVATPNDFPKLKQKAGFLTERGAMLEGFLGEYIHKWVVQNHLLPNGCPTDDLIHIYANTKQRTRETAKAFVEGAFRKCNITVYSIDSDEMDPLFNPVPTNTSEELKQTVINEMQEKIDDLQLQDAYEELSEILDYKASDNCKKYNSCNFGDAKNEIVYKVGVEPNVIGPLTLGNAIVDSFLMSYYDGEPLENVAWGKITKPEQWKLLMRIIKEDKNVKFNTTTLSKEIAKPLLKYMLEIFERENPPKFTLLVGHDFNINPVMNAIGFVTTDLPEHYERTPIGGKLVFQKWEDDNGRDFLKVDYVYQSFDQVRNGAKLSEENPPKWVSMQIQNCINDDGYCPWEKFMDVMRAI